MGLGLLGLCAFVMLLQVPRQAAAGFMWGSHTGQGTLSNPGWRASRATVASRCIRCSVPNLMEQAASEITVMLLIIRLLSGP